MLSYQRPMTRAEAKKLAGCLCIVLFPWLVIAVIVLACIYLARVV